MTDKRAMKRVRDEIASLTLLGMTLFFGVMLSAEIGEYVKDGLILAVKTVIPTSLPFMIISDFYVSYGRPENIRILKRTFSLIFGISESGLAPFICGNIGGFPIGGKMCAQSYSSGALSRDEAERLLALSSNPSCAFIIGGVGMGIYGEARIGVLLLLSIYLATIICGLVTRTHSKKAILTTPNVNISYNFVSSVRRTGTSLINIISFIAIFSAVCGMLNRYVKSVLILYLLSAFLEVTNAVKIYSVQEVSPREVGMILSAFALGFGGLSVGLQTSVFALQSGLRMRKYYLIKLAEGIISASIFSLLYMI